MTTPAPEHATTTAASPSPPTFLPPSPTTPQGVTAPILGVRRPMTPSTPSAPAAPEPGRDASAAAAPSDPLDSPGSTPWASEPAPADDPELAPLKIGKKPLADVARGLVLGASEVIHQTLARSEAERTAGVWLMDEPEAAGIADPLARIANRRSGGQLVNPDMGDLVAAAVAAASYAISNAVQAFRIRRAIRKAGHEFQHDNNEEMAA